MKRIFTITSVCAVAGLVALSLSSCVADETPVESGSSVVETVTERPLVTPEVQEMVDLINSDKYPTLSAKAFEWTDASWKDWPAVTEHPDFEISKSGDDLSAGANHVIADDATMVRQTNVCEDMTLCDDAAVTKIGTPYTLEELDAMSIRDFMG